ncbi:MAG TPA: phosphoribosyl transferase, partial [Porticoccaceae bacterium]|nr:phosphoribosyl transferase [Porticoccaceae bacterium]
MPLTDRTEGGRELAEALVHYRGQEKVLILALPRGGVPVAYEIAAVLHAPLDLVLVRKLGAPGQRELAMGAIASGGIRVLNHDLIRTLSVTERDIERVAEQEQRELERRGGAHRGG